MNDKIRELAGQALDKVVPYTWTRLDYDEIQKLQEYFAELIIQECLDVARHTILAGSGVNPDTFTGTVTTVQQIKKHFGLQ
jgi:hypothetical protein